MAALEVQFYRELANRAYTEQDIDTAVRNLRVLYGTDRTKFFSWLTALLIVVRDGLGYFGETEQDKADWGFTLAGLFGWPDGDWPQEGPAPAAFFAAATMALFRGTFHMVRASLCDGSRFGIAGDPEETALNAAMAVGVILAFVRIEIIHNRLSADTMLLTIVARMWPAAKLLTAHAHVLRPGQILHCLLPIATRQRLFSEPDQTNGVIATFREAMLESIAMLEPGPGNLFRRGLGLLLRLLRRNEIVATLQEQDRNVIAELTELRNQRERNAPAAVFPDSCDECGAEAANLRNCGRCKVAWFCSDACLKNAWTRDRGHRTACFDAAVNPFNQQQQKA
jgi:hypothetical protein